MYSTAQTGVQNKAKLFEEQKPQTGVQNEAKLFEDQKPQTGVQNKAKLFEDQKPATPTTASDPDLLNEQAILCEFL